MGFGTFLTWISLTKYLQYSKSFSTFPATLIKAGQVTLMAAISVVPMMIGLGYFCTCFFGMSWRFKTLDGSVILLWALMNGDEV